VAFVQDLSPEGALERTLPSLQAVRLAFATAALSEDEPLDVEVVSFDTQGVEAATTEVAVEIASDPRYVAAVAAPDLPGQGDLAAGLAAAEIPLLSLSARGPVDPAAPGAWLRFVAPVDAQAGALTEMVLSLRAARKGVCLANGAPDGTTFARTIRRSLPRDLEITEAEGATAITEAGCGVVVWTGDAPGGAELATALAESPTAPVLTGGPTLRDPRFLSLAASAAEGTISLCPCADVSTSLDLAAQRFIQDYQSEYGSAPGPYAVEAWDAAHLLVRALRDVGPVHADLTGRFAAQRVVEGLGGPYVFEGGELADPAAGIRRYRVEGGRWLLVGPAPR
jgi:ABC-type branched-subunit amino acid transport system substrate-binding protein